MFAGASVYGTPSPGASATIRWPWLPGTRAKIDAIARLRSEGIDAVVRDGSRATTTTALAAAAPTAGILHFATHGHLGPGRAASSRQTFSGERARSGSLLATSTTLGAVHLGLSDASLVLAEANAPTPSDDGLLGADETAWPDLRRYRLVVLSTCETGLATVDAAEEFLGLRRAFRLAGAAATVSTLWKVDDALTTTLMVDFYRRQFATRLPFSRALHAARLAVLRDNRDKRGDPLPATWGTYVFDGRDR